MVSWYMFRHRVASYLQVLKTESSFPVPYPRVMRTSISSCSRIGVMASRVRYSFPSVLCKGRQDGSLALAQLVYNFRTDATLARTCESGFRM